MGIGFRGGVFVAKSVGYRKTRRGFPLILGENGVLFLVLVARSLRVFAKLIQGSEEKIRQVVSGADPAGSVEIEDAVGLVGVNRILLHDPESAAELVGMTAVIPGQGVGDGVVVVCLPGHIGIESHIHAASERERGRPKSII